MKNPLLRYGRELVLAVLAAVMVACPGRGLAEKPVRVLFDFEEEAELGLLYWHCGAFMERDARHATSGQYSLRLEMYPSAEYPGFKTGFTQDWQGYQKLLIDIHNPGLNEMKIAYRIDDRRDNPPYADRANGTVVLKPGGNTFAVDLANLKTSGTGRRLDLARISGLYLFVHRPPQPLTLYLDNVRLAAE